MNDPKKTADWESSAWEIQSAPDPLQAMVSKAVEGGFRSPFILEFKDDKGHGFTQNLRVNEAGKIVGTDYPEYLEGTHGDERIVGPFTYTLADSNHQYIVEIRCDLKLLN